MLFSLPGLIGPASLIVALLLLIHLSARLGRELNRPRWHRLLYVSVILVGFGILTRVLGLGTPADHTVLVLLPIATGLVIAVLVVWRYWSWLLNEGTSGGS
jgi:uncharacterized membrane protein